jgi:hypothetical protein
VQLRIMRTSLADTKAAAIAATASAKASRESVDIAKVSMIASDRAYVHHAGIRHISHPLPDGSIFWRLRPLWRNSGNTPTRGLRVLIHYELRDDPLPDDHIFEFPWSVPAPPALLYPGGLIGSTTMDILGSDLADVAIGNKHLYVFGKATYRSVFVEPDEHVTRFCVKAENITGDPNKPWDEKLPFAIDFIMFSRYNCADDDCDSLPVASS